MTVQVARRTSPARSPARGSGPGVGGPAPEPTGWAATLQREILTATCWLDPEDPGQRHSATVRFSGRRIGATGRPRTGDRFTKDETVEEVVGGSGPVAVTTRISGLTPGEWLVTARPVGRAGPPLVEPRGTTQLDRSTANGHWLWPWRYRAMAAAGDAPVRTALKPLAPVPGVIPGAYPFFVVVGIVVGLVAQGIILRRNHLPVGGALTVSAWAIAAGAMGAKLWYVAGHKGRRFDGWCIQGFVVFAALVAAWGATVSLRMPVGAFLDPMAPGLLAGMGIGRIGCFFAGCCSGRPTSSRWGVWSSDQRIGARRIPTQLMESALAISIAASTFVLLYLWTPSKSGAVFVEALAMYTLGRQALLSLRARPRYTRFGRPVVSALAAAAVLAAALVGVTG